MNSNDHPEDPTFALLDFVAGLDPMRDLICGERQIWESRGFSPTVAERMAADLWGAIMRGVQK